MNKTLSLIVAASVLMMTALTVMFMANETLLGAEEDVEVSSCKNIVSAQCSDADQISIPTACTDDEGDVPDEVVNQVEGIAGAGQVNCQPYQ